VVKPQPQSEESRGTLLAPSAFPEGLPRSTGDQARSARELVSLLGAGGSRPEEVPTLYARRYSLEHGYRTAKQGLLGETPRLRIPEQFERWTDVVSVMHNTLFMARDLVAAHRQPWEREYRPPHSRASAAGGEPNYCAVGHPGARVPIVWFFAMLATGSLTQAGPYLQGVLQGLRKERNSGRTALFERFCGFHCGLKQTESNNQANDRPCWLCRDAWCR
jgi:hypothetical protein